MKTFKELGLSNDLLEIIEQEGFNEPSEIQEQAIPLALAKQDIIGGSSTGSGKTLAFASAIVQNINPNKNVQALVLTPTRELADQVASAIKKFSNNKRLRTYAIYGGVDINAQIRNIPQADIIVGTPGRILDHMKRRTLDLGNIKILVLDEVDRMLDMGFLKDVDRIITQCPTERQTMLFSATISSDLDYLAKQYTRNAKEISVKSYVDSSKLKQVYYDVQPYEKFSLLVHLLEKEKSDLVMIFCSTRGNDSGQRRSSGRNFSRGNNSGQRRSSGRNFSRGSNSGQRRDSRGNDSEQRNESGRRYNNRPNYNRARR